MIHHRIHVSGAYQKGIPWPPENGDAFGISEIRLRDHRHLIAVRLEYPADYGRPERGMIHIGVSDNVNEIRPVPAPLFHFFNFDRKKLSHSISKYYITDDDMLVEKYVFHFHPVSAEIPVDIWDDILFL